MISERGPAGAAGVTAIGDHVVPRMGFGAMRLTGPGIWGQPKDRDEARRVLKRVVELGVRLIDTADSYGPAISEEIIAEALWPYPDDLVIATKGGSLRPGPGEWIRDGRPVHLKRVCEESLRRLRLEQIPLYQLHGPDPRTPIEESIGALRDLQEAGKIRYIGVSNVSEEQLNRALAVAHVVSVQNRYNLFDRRFDALVDRCEREGLAFLPWAPLERGDVHSPLVRQIGDDHGVSAHQIMLAWLLARSPALVPLPGTGSIAHAEENVMAAGVELTPAEVACLSALA